MSRCRGFSLVELLVVIGVILVLMGLILPMAGNALGKADITRTKAILEKVEMAVRNYHSAFGVYPPELSYQYLGKKKFSRDFGVVLPVLEFSSKDIDTSKALNDQIYLDAWKNPFQYYFVDMCNDPLRVDNTAAYVELIETGSYLNPSSGASLLDFIGDPDLLQNYSAADLPNHKLNKGFLIWSMGPDSRTGKDTGDDIGNWGFTRGKML